MRWRGERGIKATATVRETDVGRCAIRCIAPASLLRRRSLSRIWRCFLLLCLATVAAQATAATELVVSAEHAAVPLDRELLRALFTMRLRTWPDGSAVRIFVLADDNPVHDQFCREQLGMYPYVLRNIWDRLEFTGTGFAPTLVHSEDEMRRQVLATQGAIGYLSSTRREPDRAPADPGHARTSYPEGRSP